MWQIGLYKNKKKQSWKQYWDCVVTSGGSLPPKTGRNPTRVSKFHNNDPKRVAKYEHFYEYYPNRVPKYDFSQMIPKENS